MAKFCEATFTTKDDEYAILNLLLTQQGCMVLPQIIITTTTQGTIHKMSTKSSHTSKIPKTRIYKVMETFSQIATTYLVQIIMNKIKTNPLD
jgi:prophage maintenance system killer protein